MATKLDTMEPQVIDGVVGPCKAYIGWAAAIKTRSGNQMVLMAHSQVALVDAIKEFNPNQEIDVNLFYNAVLSSAFYLKDDIV